MSSLNRFKDLKIFVASKNMRRTLEHHASARIIYCLHQVKKKSTNTSVSEIDYLLLVTM